MNSKKKYILAGTLFLIVGIVFVIAGILVMQQGDKLKKRCTEKTVGTVVDVICEESYSASDETYSYTYYPVIEYQAGDRTVSQKSRSGQYPPKYDVGQKVEIYYNPNNVEEYFIKGDSTPKYVGIGFIALGSIATVFGSVLLIKKAMNSRRDEE